jgi:hypothetical protein
MYWISGARKSPYNKCMINAIISCYDKYAIVQNVCYLFHTITGHVWVVDGDSNLEGRIEILAEDSKTVCDKTWTPQSAAVVCRELGYTQL